MKAAPTTRTATRACDRALPRGLRVAAYCWAWLMLCAGATAFARESLGAGDTIRIAVFQSPELAAEARLSEHGTIVYPLLGEITLGGLTTEEAGTFIGARLKQARLVANPQVSVSLVQLRSRQVSVLGHVMRPGRYALDTPNPKLTDVLALAGGIEPAGGDSVTVLTQDGGQTSKLEVDLSQMYRSGDMSKDVVLNGGEIVFVERAPVFYIYGEVQRAGAQRLERDTSVLRALSLGGGLTPRGTQRGLQIHRRMPDGSLRVIDAALADPVQADDVIYVRERLF